MDVVILNSVLGNNKSTHTKETVYIEKDSSSQQVAETQRAQANLEEQKLQEQVVIKEINTFIDILTVLFMCGVAAMLIILVAVLFL